MKKLSFILLVISFTFISCSNNDSESQKIEDSDRLTKMYKELITLSQYEIQTCTNPNEWAYVAIGEGCGGELDVIYSKKINTVEFLNKAAEYKKLRDIHIAKWGLNCGEYFYYWGKPTGLDCYLEKPILLYNNNTIPK
ncbi:hypothetical protein GKZ90_0009740 [Flavobacterium sp. MC2016-06]|jgi:hypothetical protein|uniref:hypothetical protein n=1 Tax=Flavobacterium sp. MC2016-06 TaxID=2676308 RepID=UPI0012BA87F4|nr:hypothetical protein [Flavobacterium sp. MC2016-06]MBU3859799.1 hypothetical protein [Flavobacterium sp. MC2016-06]